MSIIFSVVGCGVLMPALITIASCISQLSHWFSPYFYPRSQDPCYWIPGELTLVTYGLMTPLAGLANWRARKLSKKLYEAEVWSPSFGVESSWRTAPFFTNLAISFVSPHRGFDSYLENPFRRPQKHIQDVIPQNQWPQVVMSKKPTHAAGNSYMPNNHGTNISMCIALI